MGSVLRTGAVAGVVAVGSLLWACGESGGGTTDPPDGTAAVRVTVTRDGGAASGVSVGLYNVGSSTALSTQTTASSGEVTFSNLDPGPYEVEVALPAGTGLSTGAARQSVTATDGSTSEVSFALETLEAGDEVEILLTDNLVFSPSAVTIEVGQTVVWRNQGSMLHTITPDGHDEWTEGQVSQAGDTFSHTFESAGTFDYHCVPHLGSGMTGVITVE